MEAASSKDSLLYTKERTGGSLAPVSATQLFSPGRSAQNVPSPSGLREGQFLPLRLDNVGK